VENIRTWENDLTNVVRRQEQRAKFDHWMNSLQSYRRKKSQSSQLHHHLPLPSDIFSQFVYVTNCRGSVTTFSVAIEPLAGLTRHPWYVLRGGQYLVDKDYMFVNTTHAKVMTDKEVRFTFVSNVTSPDVQKILEQSHWERDKRGKRYIYIDFGASTYNSGAGGPSQSWFVDIFRSVGVTYDAIFAFEMSPTPADEVFRQLPADLIPKYHWYNVGVSASPTDPMFALRFLKEVAVPADYVLMKLDIDNTQVEEGIIMALLEDDVAMSLLDELFWEHHVNIKEMYSSWGTQLETRYLHDTYDLFTQLRMKGIRAHSWV
jgi:hypothetical protein